MRKTVFKSSRYFGSQGSEISNSLCKKLLSKNFIDQITLEFVNGRKWGFEVCDISEEDIDHLETLILNSINASEDKISKIEFIIDFENLKKYSNS
jgi:hypothetical protein